MYPEKLILLKEPHPLLKQKSLPITSLSGIKELSEGMYEIMRQEGGIGLAAPQVGVLVRMFIIHIIRENFEYKRVCINPEILESSGEVSIPEGCLSVANKDIFVPRKAVIQVRYQDLRGEVQEEVLTGLAAICFQHERDHLDGILISDYEKTLFK